LTLIKPLLNEREGEIEKEGEDLKHSLLEKSLIVTKKMVTK